jgi:hypothetical protein
MLKVMEATGATLGKRYNTYRYMFDRSKRVVPYHEISMDKRDKSQGLSAEAETGTSVPS